MAERIIIRIMKIRTMIMIEMKMNKTKTHQVTVQLHSIIRIEIEDERAKCVFILKRMHNEAKDD